MTENYIESKFLEKENIAREKEELIIQELAKVADSLAKAERKLEYFKKGSNAVKLQQSATNALEKMQTLETDQAQVESNIRYYRSVLEYISDSSSLEKS